MGFAPGEGQVAVGGFGLEARCGPAVTEQGMAHHITATPIGTVTSRLESEGAVRVRGLVMVAVAR